MFISRVPTLMRQKSAREDRTILQKTVAKETGLEEVTISRWMKPEPFSQITSRAAYELCRYFECNLSDLVELVPEEKPSGKKGKKSSPKRNAYPVKPVTHSVLG